METYSEDILKNGFERLMIPLRDDYEGEAVATLVRRLAATDNGKAVLYLHGFNDYFFQEEMALQFNAHGYHLYALDLRKYGRSWLPHQKFNDIRDLKAYYEEITRALEIIRQEGATQVLLLGHSTGGLILTIYAKDHPDHRLFNSLILNSPFYEFNQSGVVKRLLPLLAWLGKYIPKVKVPGGFSVEYGKSIYRGESGEWEYDLGWKPHIAPKVNLGWIRAIYRGQQELKKPYAITVPVLVMHSTRSVDDLKDSDQVHSRDVILHVEDIVRAAARIEGDVTDASIKGGLHDLVLSAKPAREKVYETIFNWLE